MNLKKFLKPDWRKIAIFIILLIISLFSKWCCGGCGTKSAVICRGVPFPYISIFWWGESKIHFLSVILNIIIFYFLSSLIIWIYDKLRKKV
jgi:hypothetical protein